MTLRHVSLEITRRCNAKCPACTYANNPMPQRSLSLSDIRRFVEANHHYFQGVFLTGGEPFMYEHLPGVVKLFKDHKKNVSVVSNGSFDVGMFKSNPDLLKINCVKFSLDFPTREEHDAWRGIEAFDNITRTLVPGLRKLGVRTELMCTVTAKNIGHIAEMLALAENLGVPVNLNRYIPSHTGDELELSAGMLQQLFKTVRESVKKGKPISYTGGLSCLIDGEKAYCSAGLDKAHISNDGSVGMCMFHRKKYGTITESLKEVHLRMVGARTTLANEAAAACAGCKMFDNGCWGDCLAVAEIYGNPKGQCWAQ